MVFAPYPDQGIPRPKDKRQVAVNRQKKIAKQKAKRKEALRVRNAHPQGVPFERRFGYTRQEIRAGEIGLAEAADVAKRDTRHYAKRQLTWFRHQTADWTRLREASRIS